MRDSIYTPINSQVSAPSYEPIVTSNMLSEFFFCLTWYNPPWDNNVKTTVAHNCHGKRINLTAKRKTSRQKEKPHGKRNNLTAKRITWPAADTFTAFSYPMVHLENSLQPPRFLRCRGVEVFLFAVSLFLLP